MSSFGVEGSLLVLLALLSAGEGCGGVVASGSGPSGGAGGVGPNGGTSGSGPSGGGGSAAPSGGASSAAPSGGVVVKQVAVGFCMSCALLSDGTVKCWGYNSNGQLGVDNGCGPTISLARGSVCDASWSMTPVVVEGLFDAVRIDAVDMTVCAVLGDGTARCWGNNARGQLGDGTTTDSATPVMVQGLTNVSAIVAGSCALLRDGTVWCWGGDKAGPALVEGLSDVEAIAGGALHTCALVHGGTVWCWGANSQGQLGNGTTEDSLSPVEVQGLL